MDGHERKASSIYKHYKNEQNGLVPKNLISQFHLLAKCKSKFDCLVKEILFISRLVPDLNVNCRQEWRSLIDTVCGNYTKNRVLAYERRRALRREEVKLRILPVCGVKARIYIVLDLNVQTDAICAKVFV